MFELLFKIHVFFLYSLFPCLYAKATSLCTFQAIEMKHLIFYLLSLQNEWWMNMVRRVRTKLVGKSSDVNFLMISQEFFNKIASPGSQQQKTLRKKFIKRREMKAGYPGGTLQNILRSVE